MQNWHQKWSQVKNEDFTVDIIEEKLFNIFLLPNKKEWKLKIFRREGFDEYLNMCAVYNKKYYEIRKMKNNFYFDQLFYGWR